MKFFSMISILMGVFLGTGIGGFYVNEGYSNNPIFFVLGIFCMITGITVAHAEREITRNRVGIHYDVAFIRGIVAILISLAISFYIIPYFNQERVLLMGILTSHILSIFFLEFDYLYNWFKGRRGKDLLYRGTEALTDVAFYKHPYLLLLVKVTLYTTTFILLYKLLL